MWVAVPGLWREKPEAGRRRIKTRKVLVEKEGLWGWNIRLLLDGAGGGAAGNQTFFPLTFGVTIRRRWFLQNSKV